MYLVMHISSPMGTDSSHPSLVSAVPHRICDIPVMNLASKGLMHPTGPLPHGCNLDDSPTRCTSLELCVSFQGVVLVARRV